MSATIKQFVYKPQFYMEVNGQLHSLATLPLVSTRKMLGRPQSLSGSSGEENKSPARN